MKDLSWALIKAFIPYFIIVLVLTIAAGIFYRLKKAAKDKINQKIAEKKTGDGICPKCGGKLIMRDGKYGRFIGCSNFPKCRYTQK